MSDVHSAENDAGVEMTSERLGENLRRVIKASGLTQADVADRCQMDPTALSKALAGKRRVTSLELALICTATGSDVLGVLDGEPLHGPSYRRGYAEALRNFRAAVECGEDPRKWLYGPLAEMKDGDYTACGAEKDGHYCDLPVHPWPQTHHADVWWETAEELADWDAAFRARQEAAVTRPIPPEETEATP